MGTSAKMILVLTVIAIFSGGVLSAWDGITRGPIEQHRQDALKEAIGKVLPEYDRYEEETLAGKTLYRGIQGGETVGYAFPAEGSGFQGKISMMVGLKPDFKELTGILVLEQIETPGLGTKIVEDPSRKSDPYWFPEQFKGKLVAPSIQVVKNEAADENDEIQAITGATISARAVVNILNKNVNQLQESKGIQPISPDAKEESGEESPGVTPISSQAEGEQ